MPSIAKKRLIWKEFKRHYLSFNQKLASTQTFGQRFWIVFEKFKTQYMNLICSRLLIVLLIAMVVCIVIK